LGRDLTDAELRDMMNEVDTDHSGSIEFNEFINMMTKQVSKEQEEEELK